MADVDAQATPRRVATLVAEGAPTEELFSAITVEAGTLLGADLAGMVRYADDGTVVRLATWAAAGDHPAMPDRWPVVDGDPLDRVARSGAPVRVQDWGAEAGPVSALIRELGAVSSVGVPIVVDDRPWGSIAVHSKVARLPVDTEARLEGFAQMLATSMAHARARARLQRLAEEQAALRRVATLVAQETTPPEVFARIVEELAGLLEVDDLRMIRYEDDDQATVVAGQGLMQALFATGRRLDLTGTTIGSLVRRSGRPARIDDFETITGEFGALVQESGVRSAVGTPIEVHGRLWGGMVVSHCRPHPLPADTEARLQSFCDLAATAISNSEAQHEIERLAAEQAALRRVATLVAEGAQPTVVYNGLIAEIADLLGADQIALTRFGPGPSITVLAFRGPRTDLVSLGTRVALDGDSVNLRVLRTGRSAHIHDFAGAPGSIARIARGLGVRRGIGTPVFVEGRVWGAINTGWTRDEAVAPGTESRLSEFAALLAVAVANADSRAQLDASRARMVAAADEARRRVVRDLHDGAQQRLVHTVVALKLASRGLAEGAANVPELVGDALEQAQRSNDELRELVRGILPAALTRGGLRAGLDALVADWDLPIDVELPGDRFAPGVEASAYFVVTEALTNVLKHAQARRAAVLAEVAGGMLELEVRDDGIGGADASGAGIVGIADRVEALGGRLRVESPAGGGTVVRAVLPIGEWRPGANSG